MARTNASLSSMQIQSRELDMNEYLSWVLKKTPKELELLGDNERIKALVAVSRAGEEETVQRLLDFGTNVNALSEPSGMTPLQIAAANGHRGVVERLITAGAGVNFTPPSRPGATTALLEAAVHEHIDLVKYLVEQGANIVDIRMTEDMMPIHWAVIHGDPLLLARWQTLRADTNVEDSMGRNPIHIAAHWNRPENLRWLLRPENKFPNSINAKDLNGSTPLHLAIEAGCFEVFECLLKEGANIRIQDNKKCTPLDLALARKQLDMVNELLGKGASPNGISAREWSRLLGEKVRDEGDVDDEERNDESDKEVEEERVVIISQDHGRIKPIEEVSGHEAIRRVRAGYKEPDNCLFSTIKIGKASEASLYDPDTVLSSSRPAKKSHLESKASVRWTWRSIKKNQFGDGKDKDRVQNGFPGLEDLITNPSMHVSLRCFASFRYYRPLRPSFTGLNESFPIQVEYSRITWVMESSKLHYTDLDRRGLKDAVPILKSKTYVSSLRCGWPPVHGVEFFTMFVHELLPKWEGLIDAAENHLSGVRKNLLKSGGETNDLIKPLLKDAQKWIMLRKLLQEHIQTASEFLKLYENDDFLREEVALHEHRNRPPKRPLRDHPGLPLESPRVVEYFDVNNFPKPSTWLASKQLRRAIKDLKSCQSRISSLDKDTKTMVQLQFNLASIYETHSMKRLSWVAVIFLPLTFTASLFGMNVNLLEYNASWWWYLVLSCVVIGLMLVIWIIVKNINRWRKAEKKRKTDLEMGDIRYEKDKLQ